MFSIVMPVYNKEEQIRHTIKSIINQTHHDFELIVVDDGSCDSSIDIVNSMQDCRFTIISQDNQGVSAARNKGIRHASNEWICFIDADDIWHPRYLETMEVLIKKFPQVGALYSRYREFETMCEIDFNEQSSTPTNGLLIDDYFTYSLEHTAMWTSAVIVRKEALNHIGGFPEMYSRGEDLFVWAKIALAYPIAHTDFVGAYYNKGVGRSLSRIDFPLEKSFSNDAEDFYLQNKSSSKDQNSFREYMIPTILSKAKYLIYSNRRIEARAICKRYWPNRYSKKKAILIYVLSYAPDILLKKGKK